MTTDLNAIKSKLTQTMRQLKGMGNSGSLTGGEASKYINSVWSLAENGMDAINGGDAEKAQAINNFVQNIFRMLSNIGTKESSAAQKETKTNDVKARQNEQAAHKDAQTTEDKLSKILGEAKNNEQSITDALKEIENLGGDSGIIAECKTKLEEQKRIIDENIAILNGGILIKPEQKQTALQNIENASLAIAGLVISVANYQSELESQVAKIGEATDNLNTQFTEFESTVQAGVQKAQKNAQNNAQQTAVTTQTSAKGATNQVEGAALTRAGEAASASVVAASQASQLIMAGNDRTMAGNTRITNSAKTLSTLTNTIGSITLSVAQLSDKASCISSIGNSAFASIGQAQTKLEPMITACGSWVKVAEANVELAKEVTRYKAEIEKENEQQNKNPLQDIYNQDAKTQNYSKTNSRTNVTANSSDQVTVNQGLIFNFDTKKFAEAFKVQAM